MRLIAFFIAAGIVLGQPNAQQVTIPLRAGDTIRGVGSGNAFTVFGNQTNSQVSGVLAQGSLTGSIVAMYTVPANVTANISMIVIANPTASPITGTALYINGAASANQIVPPMTMPANGNMTLNGSGHFETHDSQGRLLIAFSGSVPPNAIIGFITGDCPTGWSEAMTLDGRMMLGTIKVHADQGDVGGNDFVSSLSNPTVPPVLNDPTLDTFAGTPQTFSTAKFTVDAGGSDAFTGPNPYTPAGFPTVTLQDADITMTPTPFDNRSRFQKVIFCSKDP